MRSLSFTQLFALFFIAAAGLLAASALSAWTGPTATAPGGNTSAPLNVGTTDQVKNAGLSVNALAIFGSGYVQNKLGIGTSNPGAAIHISGNAGEDGLYIGTVSAAPNTSPTAIEVWNDRGLLAAGSAGYHEIETDYLGNFRIERPQVVSSMPDLTIAPSGKIGIHQVAPVSALDVNGTVHLGNGGESCSAGIAGAIRYNSATSFLEYCNGSVWAPVGGVVKFGGTYLLRNLSGASTGSPTGSASCTSPNIYTGNCTCPTGYSARSISYTPYNGTSGELWSYSCESN